jgi:hypothetical protein
MIEFVQDLLFRGSRIDLNIRAVITFGEFEHYNLKNANCYYGKALVSAYLYEKEINGIGLFIDSKLEKFNKIFKTCKYSLELNFVYLFQTIITLKSITDDQLPLPRMFLEDSYEFWQLKDEVKFLQKYFHELNKNESPKIRAKYLQTYQFYRMLMPCIFDQLEKTDFDLSTINPEVNWNEIKGYNG